MLNKKEDLGPLWVCIQGEYLRKIKKKHKLQKALCKEAHAAFHSPRFLIFPKTHLN